MEFVNWLINVAAIMAGMMAVIFLTMPFLSGDLWAFIPGVVLGWLAWKRMDSEGVWG